LENGEPFLEDITVIFDNDDGMYSMVFYRRPGTGVSIEVEDVSFESEPCPTVADCNPIPTLSQWGLIILGLCLSIFGIVAVRHKSLVTS